VERTGIKPDQTCQVRIGVNLAGILKDAEAESLVGEEWSPSGLSPSPRKKMKFSPEMACFGEF